MLQALTGFTRVKKKNNDKSDSGLRTSSSLLDVHKLTRLPPHCQQLTANTWTLTQHQHHHRFCTLNDCLVYFVEINLIPHLLLLHSWSVPSCPSTPGQLLSEHQVRHRGMGGSPGMPSHTEYAYWSNAVSMVAVFLEMYARCTCANFPNSWRWSDKIPN